MAEAPNQPPAPLPTAEEIAAHNAATAARVAAQDIFAQSNAGNPNSDAGPALDQLIKAAETAAAAAPAAAEPPAAAATPPAEAAPAAAEPPAAAQPPVEDPVKKKADEIFKNAPTLPPNASPKSAEAFASVKLQAARDISERDSKIESLTKELSALKESSSKPTDEQVAKEAELKDLRDWRAKLDVDFDPAFKSFDAKIAKGREFIYSQLRKSPMIDESTIEQIKKLGGPENVNLDKVWAKINDNTLKSIVESQISELARTGFEKKQAIDDAKKNLDQYLANRASTFDSIGNAHQTNTQKELDAMMNSLEWFKPQTAKAEADEVTKKAAADHNAFIEEARGQMAEALKDDSPRMRAILIAGTLQLFNLQRVHAATKSALDATQKQLAEVTAKWEKVKQSGRALGERGSAPPSGVLPVAPKVNNFTTDASSALDQIAKQVSEEYNAKLGANG